MTKLIAKAQARLATLRNEETGATAIEYGLIAGLISVVIIATLILVGGSLDDIFVAINTALDNATP